MIPEDKWTKWQREFIGSTFTTKKGGLLTVVGVDHISKSGVALFSVECSICSKDKELFPEGFVTAKGHLVGGKLPCGCSKINNPTKEQNLILANRLLIKNNLNLKAVDVTGVHNNKRFTLHCSVCSEDVELWPLGSITATYGNLSKGKVPCSCTKGSVNWKEWQAEIRVRRLCDELNYTFYGWHGSYNGNFTKLDLYNPETGNRWNTTSLSSFTIGHRDPWLHNKSLPDSFHIDEFLKTGSYNEYTTFKRIPKTRRGLWEVKCGKCGVVYTSGMANLKRGQLGCDCAEPKGFDRSKPALIYINRFSAELEPKILKFGITNNRVVERRKSQEGGSGLKGKTVFTYYSQDGSLIAELEKELGKIIKLGRVLKEDMPDGYTESVYYKPFIEKFIINYLNMLTKSLNVT